MGSTPLQLKIMIANLFIIVEYKRKKYIIDIGISLSNYKIN